MNLILRVAPESRFLDDFSPPLPPPPSPPPPDVDIDDDDRGGGVLDDGSFSPRTLL